MSTRAADSSSGRARKAHAANDQPQRLVLQASGMSLVLRDIGAFQLERLLPYRQRNAPQTRLRAPAYDGY